MRRIEDFVDVGCLHDFFVCDPVAGKLYWKARSETDWRIKTWNKRFACTEAGSPNPKGYILVGLTVDGVKFHPMVHRIIWAMTFGEWVPTTLEIDHRNSVRSNNAITNLRVCTRRQNCQNKIMQKNNTSGFKGVHWYPRYSKWTAIISIYGKSTNLGYYEHIEDAISAYDVAAHDNFEEFSRSNLQLGLVA
jgi:hypothetical protein